MKYDNNLLSIDREISVAQASLSTMIEELTGDDYDMKGLALLKSMLLGE